MYLTFGKYSGKTVEVVSKDKQYSRWLISQPWFSIKHADMYGDLIKELNDPLICDKTIQPRSENSFIVYTDGACKNNGQTKAMAGIGIHFPETNKIQIEDKEHYLILENYIFMNLIAFAFSTFIKYVPLLKLSMNIFSSFKTFPLRISLPNKLYMI